jgi:magnesium chelatase subunit I
MINNLTFVRLYGNHTSITGKVELVYEGEQEGAAGVAQNLIASAIHTFFPGYFLKSRRKPDAKRPTLI